MLSVLDTVSISGSDLLPIVKVIKQRNSAWRLSSLLGLNASMEAK